jgi:uncharacterized protein YcaQ
MTSRAIRQLRARAIAASLFPPASLRDALRRALFVQADPIRAPARAQDLTLRHRVHDYRAGDLEARYPSLELEEDVLYGYGFLPREIWELLHPRRRARSTRFQAAVLDVVRAHGELHPGALEAHFGGARAVNAWGGTSRRTKLALDELHYRGLLRVARRDNGIRVYAPAVPAANPLPAEQRARRLILVLARIFAPAPERSLAEVAARLRRSFPMTPRSVLRELIDEGRLERRTVDGVAYVAPGWGEPPDEPARVVRFLAPFDPVIWDRRRFEHLWGWPYRFEAYTPPARRIRGYYAMPLLWGDAVIGWANVDAAGPRLDVTLGFVGRRPADAAFRAEVDAEIARLERFLTARP